MSHDGSKPTYDANAPSAQSCSWNNHNIMGLPTYVKAQTQWSSCSISQLQYWVQYSGRSNCVRTPPASNPYPIDPNTLSIYDVNRQCQIRHGPSAVFPSFCQSASTHNDEMCYKLMCYDNAKRACQYGYGAVPGTTCGPSGEICYQGRCQSRSNTGTTNTGNTNTGQTGNTGSCADKSITLAGLSCYAWLSQNLGACDHPTITTNCCASRARLCTSSQPSVPAGCADKSITLAGLSCYAWLSQNLVSCNHPTITTNCCASRARLCNSNSVVG
ncbi:A disintegrin and metalloproteinase with thrombospondin motifs 4-like [Watersipora subatra]|uniref:A disintegrin and metalloproteinase with thrombospondin motifs 4-like n=1 Tax=Watersipora subatra TaxID=2589382 RepID=UPI00355C1DEE